MSGTITPIGDNPQVPSATAYSYLPDQLIAGFKNLVTQPIVLGAGNLVRGTVLGQQTDYTVRGTPKVGNTGNGTISNLSPGAGAEYSTDGLPTYEIVATDATHFTVTDPEGTEVGVATAGTAFTSSELNLTITAGATAFVAGDAFTVTVIPGTGTYIASVKTATDGSQVPSAILVDNVNATNGPVQAGAYVAGEFNGAALTIDASWSLPQIVAALRAMSIFVKSSVVAADPTTPTS